MLRVKMLFAYHISGSDTQSWGGGCTTENSRSLHAKMRITSLGMCAHTHTRSIERQRAAAGKSRTPVAFWHSHFAKILLNKISTFLLIFENKEFMKTKNYGNEAEQFFFFLM